MREKEEKGTWRERERKKNIGFVCERDVLFVKIDR